MSAAKNKLLPPKQHSLNTVTEKADLRNSTLRLLSSLTGVQRGTYLLYIYI